MPATESRIPEAHEAAWLAAYDDALAAGRSPGLDEPALKMHGNVWEWCQDYRSMRSGDSWVPISERGSQGQPHEDREMAERMVRANDWRAMRGGSFLDPAARLRSAYHQSEVITHRSRDAGFRLARTVP